MSGMQSTAPFSATRNMFKTPISLNDGSPQVGAERVSSVDEGVVDDKR